MAQLKKAHLSPAVIQANKAGFILLKDKKPVIFHTNNSNHMPKTVTLKGSHVFMDLVH